MAFISVFSFSVLLSPFQLFGHLSSDSIACFTECAKVVDFKEKLSSLTSFC